ncbi:MAG: YerC/YecD family TrpR-related protein [Patescibacteria group bacterium]
MHSWKTPHLKNLARAFLSLKTEKDMLNFLRDLCTLDELEEFAMRWQVAQLISRGISYRDIGKKVGVSTTTVSRVAQWLHHGEGGYKKAIEKQKT